MTAQADGISGTLQHPDDLPTMRLAIGDDCSPTPSAGRGDLTILTPEPPPVECTTPRPTHQRYYDLYSDFGVVRKYEFDIYNPTSKVQDVDIYFDPRAKTGAQGTFLVGDDAKAMVIQTDKQCDRTFAAIGSDCVGTPGLAARYLLQTFEIPPRTTLPVRILTMGEGDSSYPAYLEEGQSLPHQSFSPRTNPRALNFQLISHIARYLQATIKCLAGGVGFCEYDRVVPIVALRGSVASIEGSRTAA